MANVPRSSFIPKQVTSSAIPKKVRHTKVFSIFSFVAGALLFVSLLLSAGVYFLKDIEEKKLEAQRAALASERGKFNDQDIAEVRSFDKRIELARSLLDTHVSPTKIFEALEQSTKQSVQYTSLAYARRPSGDVSLDLFGVTDDFAKVALQSMQYSEDFILKDMTVTEVGINLEGAAEGAPASSAGKQVNFKIVSNVEASKLLFEPDAAVPDTSIEPVEAATSTDSEGASGEGASLEGDMIEGTGPVTVPPAAASSSSSAAPTGAQ